MGYRWYKGQFVDNDEYQQLQKGERQSQSKFMGGLIVFFLIYGSYVYFFHKSGEDVSKSDTIMFFISLALAYILRGLGALLLYLFIGIAAIAFIISLLF